MDVSQPLPIRVLFLTGTSEEEAMHPQVMRAGQELDLFLGHLKTILLETKLNHLTQTEGKYLGKEIIFSEGVCQNTNWAGNTLRPTRLFFYL